MDLGFKLYFTDKTEYVPLSSLNGETMGNTTVYTAEVNGVNVNWAFEHLPLGDVISLEVEGDGPLGISRIDSLAFDIDSYAVTDRIPFFGTNADHTETRYPCELVENESFTNNATGLFPNLAAPGMAIAFLAPFRNHIGAGVIKHGGTLSYLAKTMMTEGDKKSCKIRAERVFFSESITIDALFDVYREYIPQSSFPMPKLTGWNSWDFYEQSVTPEDIFENVDFLKTSPFKEHLKYIIIDDGWQSAWGDWWENDKFACGLDYVAQRIREAGFTPGIWMAPLRINKNAEMFKDHMHWFCKDERSDDGVLKFGEMYCVDPTVPEARQYILDTYKRLYGYGYRVFKIDYLAQLLWSNDLHDPDATPYSALSDLMLDIQKATGEDAIILGCSLPVQCGANIAPTMRVGVDIRIHFSHIEWAAESLAWTWMYNNRTTRIDPDFLVVRGDETSDDNWTRNEKYLLPGRRGDVGGFNNDTRWGNGDRFNAIEAETWANIVAISGGNMILSDRMTTLNEKGIAIINNAFKVAQNECRPVFLEDDIRLPSVWKGESAVLIINWENVPMTKTVRGVGKSPSSDKPIVVSGEDVTVSLLPHESVVVFIN